MPPLSKNFERLMQKQINEHIKNKLSSYLCRYKKGFSTQYAFEKKTLLGPLLFNIFSNDLFFLVDYTEVCSFADDTIFFACDKDLGSLINRLKHGSFLAID